jgi:hypothetical protein
MPHDAGILKKGMFALKDVVVSTANADPARPDERLPSAWSRLGPLLQMELAGASAYKCIGELQGGVSNRRFCEIERAGFYTGAL